MPWLPSRTLHPLDIGRRTRALMTWPVDRVYAALERTARLSTATGCSPQVLFLRELMARPRAVGAVCASSPRLAQRMAACVDPNAAGWVVELGGGTGVVTAALLARGVPAERLVVVERSERMAAHLRRRFLGVRVLHGDAAQLGDLLAGLGSPSCGTVAEQIVSGLPLLSIAEPMRSCILRAGAMALAPGGRLVQFTYAPRGASPWTCAGLCPLERKWVLANLPPARIDVMVQAGAH